MHVVADARKRTARKSIMELQHYQQDHLEAQRLQSDRDELIWLIARAVREDGKIEPVKGMILQRASSPGEPLHIVADPSFCVIAQGRKEIILCEESYQYDPAHYLLITTELPVTGHIREASQEKPYLSFRLILDAALVQSVMVETDDTSPQNQTDLRAISVSSLEGDLLDAVLRFVRLVDRPAEAPFLAPLIKREIIFRLWRGEQSARLRHIAANSSYTTPIAKAIERLRTQFDQPLRIEEIAHESGMCVSGFHHHFKAVTAMSPLQFQKVLRLQEARRLMLGEQLDAASAAFRVGYDDASHFSREYKRHFGLPPVRDIEQLRKKVRQSAS